MTMEDDGSVFLECQECLAGYFGVRTDGTTFRCEDLTRSYRPSTPAEVHRETTRKLAYRTAAWRS